MIADTTMGVFRDYLHFPERVGCATISNDSLRSAAIVIVQAIRVKCPELGRPAPKRHYICDPLIKFLTRKVSGNPDDVRLQPLLLRIRVRPLFARGSIRAAHRMTRRKGRPHRDAG